MQFKFVTAAMVAALVCAPANGATKIDDPVKFVRGVYEKLAPSKDYTPPEDIYTRRLAALFALEKRDAGDEVGTLDFVFWVNGQDWELSDVKVTGTPLSLAKDREVVVAKFKNMDHNEEIHFYFEKARTGWQLDDARAVADQTWTLSLILKYANY